MTSTLLQRHPENPILKAGDCPFPATLVFNAGVTRFEGRWIMVFRNDVLTSGGTDVVSTNIGVAESHDGVAWEVWPKPVMDSNTAAEGLSRLISGRYGPAFFRRIYDPRISVVDGRPLLCFAADTEHGICGVIAATDDFKKFEFLSLSAPDNRNMVLFPERIGGDYVRLERPFPVYGCGGEHFPMWMSRSHDLLFWGRTSPLLSPADFPYVNSKIGPAAPPVRTRAGWLVVTHGVSIDTSKPLKGWETRGWFKTYFAGLVLLDLNDPSQVIGILREPLLSPETDYELDGFRGSVIFPCGLDVDPSSEDVRLYYGAADTSVALATGKLADLLNALVR